MSIQSLDSRGSPLVTKIYSCSCATEGVSRRNWVVAVLAYFSLDRFRDTGAKVTSPYTAPAVAPCIVQNKLQNPELTGVSDAHQVQTINVMSPRIRIRVDVKTSAFGGQY